MTVSEPAKILIVDDESNIREILSEILEDEGYHIFEAENGEIALEIVAKESFDLIISDVQMPVMDGIALLKALPATVEVVPKFIFLSGYCDISSEDAAKLGAEKILGKPFDIAKILDTVEDALSPNLLTEAS